MFTIKDVEKMMKLARETCDTAPIDIPDDIKEATVGLMVGMYLKGFNDCLRTQELAQRLMGNQMKEAMEYFDKLYNVNNK
jgi:hypothetical protein